MKRAYPVTDDASLKEATQRDEYETDLVVEVDASSDLSRLSVSGQPVLAPSVSPSISINHENVFPLTFKNITNIYIFV